jgi:hypothetical protein
MKIKPLGAFRGGLCVCVCVLAVYINFMIFETQTIRIHDSLKLNWVANKPEM